MSTTTSDHKLSVWMYGFFHPDEFHYFSFEVSGLLKPRGTDDDLLSPGEVIKPTSLKSKSKLHASEAVALRRFVYIIGGTKPYVIPPSRERYIQCLDSASKDGRCVPYSMKKGRCGAQVADLDGKIHIFGGDKSYDDKSPPSSEVFDTRTGTVETVETGELGYKGDLMLIGVDRELKRIMFLPNIFEIDLLTKPDGITVVFYEPEKKKWDVEPHPKFGSYIYSLFDCSARVFVGSTIYWFSYMRVMAYDFVKREVFQSGILKDLPGCPHLWEIGFRFTKLFHMNEDYFCLLWMHGCLDEQNQMQVYCSKLSVSSCASPNKLRVSVLDTDTYFIPGGVFHVMDALQVA